MNCIVIEPKSKVRKLLDKHLCQLDFPEIVHVELCDSTEEAMDRLHEVKFDLIFLNIDMDGGIEFMNHVRQVGRKLVIIANEASMLTDILNQTRTCSVIYKPFDMLDVQQALTDLYFSAPNLGDLNHFQDPNPEQHMRKLSISSSKKIQFLYLDDIVYCKASSQYTEFHLKCNSMVLSSKTLAHYEDKLKHSNFMRIHRSYLVNLEHVSEFHRHNDEVLLSNNNSIKLSNTVKEAFLMKMEARS